MFRKILERVSAVLSGLTIGITIFSMAAFALTVPSTFAPRNFQSQQVGYFRVLLGAQAGAGAPAGVATANGFTCAMAGGSTGCSIKVGALPYNSFMLRASLQVLTAFNSTTTDTVALCTTTTCATGSIISPATSTHTAANGAAIVLTVGYGLGNNGSQASPGATGWNAVQTGSDGGFDLYVNFQSTGTNGPTAGQAVLLLEYAAPNDGACFDVPMGSTAAAC
jgi:hypothetical protein